MQFHDIRACVSATERLLTLHVLVPGRMTVREGHKLLDGLESDIPRRSRIFSSWPISNRWKIRLLFATKSFREHGYKIRPVIPARISRRSLRHEVRLPTLSGHDVVPLGRCRTPKRRLAAIEAKPGEKSGLPRNRLVDYRSKVYGRLMPNAKLRVSPLRPKRTVGSI
ncbi:cation transporter dimerization domain-containing protein [Methylocaldum szegediense]|uniref:cation transporter dimerization domain-containing protein n=1 Tax=Methylocaldum szegediense TaxID=73780 RepID=UPI000A075323